MLFMVHYFNFMNSIEPRLRTYDVMNEWFVENQVFPSVSLWELKKGIEQKICSPLSNKIDHCSYLEKSETSSVFACLSLSLSLFSLSLTLTHTHTQSLSNSLSLSLTQMHTLHSLSRSLSHTRFLSLTQKYTLYSLTKTLSISL